MPDFTVPECEFLTAPNGTFASPNYPSYYDNNLKVCWLINGDDHVRISFPDFYTEAAHDFVRVYGGESTSCPLLLELSGGSYFGNYRHTVVSPTDKMLVTFASDSSGNRKGFEASYSSCSILTSASGTISSPNYPDSYNELASVCWIVSPPVGYVVTLSFNTFATEFNFDLVRVFDGNSTKSPRLLSASGNTIPSDVTSSSNAMLIVFSSDLGSVRPGFQATFNSILTGETFFF